MTTSTPITPLGRPAPGTPGNSENREVLVGVDGSEIGLGAVRWAVREAARRGAPLRIVHAAPYLSSPGSGGAPPPELHRARRITAQAYTVARHTDPGVPTSTEVVPGDPTSALLRGAAAGQLVVLGSSTTGAADELVLASVAVRVAARSPQPVVVVPRRRSDDAGHRPVVAVLGVGDRDDDEAVAAFAADAAQRAGGGLTVLQTRSPKRPAVASWVDDDEEWQRRYPELHISRSDLPAPRADQLLGATCPAPLLVISAGSGSLLHRNLDGPHRWLLRHCTSPMALVPPVHRPSEEPREEIIALG
ncbi:nucleotide-binding universal stress UspA family protein [Blastococcus colisei]|uniref:Nucleotide-binding universal stress UspA family protein n=1 Tax=Blastococcus colisei TaxID=1564162 RepID=A0A543P0T4_9ACTN|nr:universal stress protein [Blastococcus colisei]TQN37695.1 nucleotide-binding universal stress UspA family protein [Blastococcus colisei]